MQIPKETVQQIFDEIQNFFTNELEAMLNVGATGIANNLAPIFLIGFSIYVVLISLNWLREGVDENLIGTVKSITGWLFVIAIAFNAQNYLKISLIVYGLPDELAEVFVGTNSGQNFPFSASFDVIMGIVDKFDSKIASLAWYEADQILYYIYIFILIGSGFAMFVMAYAFFLIAKISLLLTLLIGPVFVGFMLIPSTRQYGMNWIGQLLNYTFTIVMYVILVTLMANLTARIFNIIAGDLQEISLLTGAFTTAFSLGSLILLLVLLLNVPSIASALTGGASMQMNYRSASRLASGVASGGVTTFKQAASGVRRFSGSTNSIKGK